MRMNKVELEQNPHRFYGGHDRLPGVVGHAVVLLPEGPLHCFRGVEGQIFQRDLHVLVLRWRKERIRNWLGKELNTMIAMKAHISKRTIL